MTMEENKKLSIVFMGTPEFAVTILEKIITEGFNVKAVVTVPDKQAGRGRKLHQSAVKNCALQYHLPILQPEKLKSEAFINQLSSYHADLFVVVAFRMLPEAVWKLPQLGTFNLHASLLPQYRGAAPINWAVINGETETGVTTFFIDKKIDTGNIIMQQKMTIGANETAGELHDRMMDIGANTVVKTIQLIQNGTVEPFPQDHNKALQPAPKIVKQDCLINFDQEITSIHNFIRGMSPYPTAWLRILYKKTQEIKTVKIFSTSLLNQHSYDSIALQKKDKQLCLQLKDGALLINEIQLEGKKRLKSHAFLSGFNPDEWEIVT